MKRFFYTFLHLFILLTLSARGLRKTSPSPTPNATGAPMPSGLVIAPEAINRLVNLPLNYFSGEWKTKENASPKISIFFYEQGYQIKIDDKIVTMTGGQLSDVTFPPFFHFQNLIIRGPYRGETYRDLGLVNGVIGTVEVLSGFYSERDHESEGVIKRGFSTPVILYQQKLGRRD